MIQYKNNELYIENVSLTAIAKQYGTPSYVYSREILENNWREFDQSFKSLPHRICYAVKANSNIGLLNVLAKLQSGFDIVSQGELERVLQAGGDPKKIVFSGVGKEIHEINRALEIGIFCFNIESSAELERINSLAEKQNKIANIALRINPNIDARTHPYIATGLSENKFGIEIAELKAICENLKKLKYLKLIGIGCHIGSQLTELDPFLEAIDCVLDLFKQIQSNGFNLTHIDIGGGLGVRYRDETPPAIKDYAIAVKNKFEKYPIEVIIEPGRALVANAGILLTSVEYIKHTSHKNFAIVNAGMNDLMRPALYDAWHKIIPISLQNTSDKLLYDVVGPVCESSDFLGKDRELSIEQGDLLAVCEAGAYGFSMSSNYNTRPRPAEILVDGDKIHLIRKRETIADLITSERILE